MSFEIDYPDLEPVAPMEIESILSEHPAIADSAVIGVVTAEGNELPR